MRGGIESRRRYYFFPRMADKLDCPAGITVSKKSVLPNGDFRLDEYIWPDINFALWFVAADNWTAEEREEAIREFKLTMLTAIRHESDLTSLMR